MRAPDDMPRRRRRRGRSSGSSTRRRVFIIVGAILIFLLLTSLRGIARVYTDFLWFDSLGQWGTKRTLLSAQLTLSFIFIATFFALAWTSLYVAERLAPPFRPSGPEDELLERYHELVGGRMAKVRVAVALLLALIAGTGAGSEWNSWLLFRHGGDFGVDDPQFNQDVGFYVFKLPFIAFVVDWLFAALLIVLIITAVAHYLNGGIRVQPPSPRVTPQVKGHLSVLLAVLALVKTADYWLQRFELTGSSRGVVDGASYTDVHAQLPALNLLVLISVAGAALFIANIFRRGWALPVVAAALWLFVALAVGGIYPEAVQFFSVRPNESAKESPYIERNIEATRTAMGVDNVEDQSYPPSEDPAGVDPSQSQSTIQNIRLWDPSADISGKVFDQLQRRRDYYTISDIDVDRYEVDGEMVQMELGARVLNSDRIPGGSWENQHLAYTHGYGVVAAPSNATSEGEPNFSLRDIPVSSSVPSLEIDQPGIYFGENQGGYSVVNTGRDEIDFRTENETETTRYDGDDGVEAGSLLRRTAFALRFGDVNPLISGYMDAESRVVFNRDVVDRVNTLAPFLEADADPYPVVLDGKVLWVIDLYTTTNRYPYSQSANTDEVTEASGLRGGDFNYVRNSVKATVDAYDGTVNLYVMNDEDPIINAYRKALPDLFSERDDMPAGLEEHLRYPEDLFRLQTATWERYHLDTASEFYSQEDAWRIARNPGTVGEQAGTPVTNEEGEPTGLTTSAPIPPYYQLLQLPDEDESEFVMLRPFVPASGQDRGELLQGYMAARMDPGHYGELVVYQMESADLPQGPGLVQGAIQANDAVAQFQTLMDQTGSRAHYGNLLLLPIGDALLYVEPVYVEAEAEARQIPQLRKVIAVLGNNVVMGDSLRDALDQLFGEDVTTQEGGTPEEGEEEPGGDPSAEAAQLLDEAEQLFVDADQALEEGDLGTYETKIDEARAKLNEAMEQLGATPAPPGETSDDSGDGNSEDESSSSTTTTTRPE